MAEDRPFAYVWNALRSLAHALGPKTPDLDSFGEIYPGFDRDRQFLKSRLVDANAVWRQAFRRVRRTEEFYQRSDHDVARETTRVLLEWLAAI